jgi:tetratricopeptide (TPR) repeat protein
VSNPQQWYDQAIDALNRGDWRLAQNLASRVVPYAQHGGVHYIAGVAALQLNQLGLAIEHLRRAVQISPDRPNFLAQYARALAMTHRFHEAVQVANAAMALPSADSTSLDTLGVVYDRANAHERALEAFRRAVELAPGHAGHHFNLATSFMFFGDLQAAEREYEACLSSDPGYWRAHLSLAQLRTQTRHDNHVHRLEAQLLRYPEDPEAQLYLNLSLAKEHEDCGDYVEAFDFYTRGKSAHRKQIDYSTQRDAAVFEAVMDYFDEPVTQESGFMTEEPIFVMGMPRSGTTLVDRIISAHSGVYSAGELNDFRMALQWASGRPARSLIEVIASLGRGFTGWAGIGKRYVESTRPATGHTPRFIDKLPHNFLHAGFIAHALPNARIICLRRNPMDTCLSNFRQLFALESPDYDYSYELLETGRYYLLFDRLMKHWQRVLPGRIVEVDYENLVESPETTTRMLLDACGLPWERACLDFDRNNAPVTTASATQVRSPINRSSMERWKRHEAQLRELRVLLEDGGIQVS